MTARTQREKNAFKKPGTSINLQHIGLSGYLRQHRLALLHALKTMITTPIASLLTFLVIGFAIILPLALALFLNNLQAVAHSWESTQLTVYFKKNFTAADKIQFETQLKHNNLIAHFEFIPAAQGIKDFEKQTGLQNVLTALDENPLPDVMIIYPVAELQTPALIKTLIAELKQISQVATVQSDMAWVQRLYVLSSLAKKVFIMLAVLLSFGVLVTIVNTIRLISQANYEKIKVIKLLGGSNRFICRPFLYLGLFYSVGGCLLAVLALDFISQQITPSLKQLTELYHLSFHLEGLDWVLNYQVLLASAVLGYLGAWLSVHWQIYKFTKS